MKIGFDVHGVIDKNYSTFAFLSKIWGANGHEVHIVTGNRKNHSIEEILYKYNIVYTHFFSVTDYLIEHGYNHTIDDKNNLWFDEDVWNCQKGNYASRVGLDIHYDDSDVYGKYFPTTTNYLQVYAN